MVSRKAKYHPARHHRQYSDKCNPSVTPGKLRLQSMTGVACQLDSVLLLILPFAIPVNMSQQRALFAGWMPGENKLTCKKQCEMQHVKYTLRTWSWR